MHATPSHPKGFTLLETVIAIGIFSVIMLVTVNGMLSVTQAASKADQIRQIEDNLRFTLEAMTREIRTGTSFTAADIIDVIASGSASAPLYGQLGFNSQRGVHLNFCYDGSQKAIGRYEDTSQHLCDTTNPSFAKRVTSPVISIDRLGFIVTGTAQGPIDGQPRITIIIKAHSTDPALGTNMQIQTTVTQRLRDSG